jgi:hypothetical protein
VACAVAVRRPACLGREDVGGAVAVDVAVDVDVDVAAAVAVVVVVAGIGAAEGTEVVAVGVAVAVAGIGDAGRKDTCWGSSCGCPRGDVVPACNTRWSMGGKIAVQDVGGTDGPGCGLTCRLEAAMLRGGEVVGGGGRYHRQESMAGRHDRRRRRRRRQRQRLGLSVSRSLASKQASKRASTYARWQDGDETGELGGR